jgi:hypothetical protein
MYVLRRILNPMGTMDMIDFLLDNAQHQGQRGILQIDEYLRLCGRAKGASPNGALFPAPLHVAVYAAATLQHELPPARRRLQ